MKIFLLPITAIVTTIGLLMSKNLSGRLSGNYSGITESFLSYINAKEERRKAGIAKKPVKPGKYVELHMDIPNCFSGFDKDNTISFARLINCIETYKGGRLHTGNDAANNFVPKEVRFVPWKTRKVPRFTVPPMAGTNSDGGAGVQPNLYQIIFFSGNTW